MAGSPIDSSFQFSTVTASDTKTLTYHGQSARAKGFYILTNGNLAIKDDLGTAVTFTGVVAGSVLPISSDTVMSTNTTATVIALF